VLEGKGEIGEHKREFREMAGGRMTGGMTMESGMWGRGRGRTQEYKG
jgi:hypothetical protein